MSTAVLGGARVTLVSALTWRAIAELARRHGHCQDVRLVQFHPGNSMHGVIGLALREPATSRTVVSVDFNLGGPSGTYTLQQGEGRVSLAELLGEGPARVIDAIETDLGLPHLEGALPPSTPRCIALRLIASLLERLVFEPVAWRASLAVWAWNGESHVEPWHARVPGNTLPVPPGEPLSPEDHDRLSDLVLVHASCLGAGFDANPDRGKRAIAVDLATGHVSLLTAVDTVFLGECWTLYQAQARSMRRMVAAIEATLHSQ
jgi:hypothetical protein